MRRRAVAKDVSSGRITCSIAGTGVEVSVYVVQDFSLDHVCIVEVTARRSGITACYTSTTNSSC